MDFYQNVTDNTLALSYGTNVPLTALAGGVRGSKLPLRFLPFARDVQGIVSPAPLSSTYQLVFCLKVAVGDDPNPIALATAFTAADAVYAGELDLGSVQMTQVFVGAAGVDASTAASVTVELANKGRLLTSSNEAAQSIKLPKDITAAFAVGEKVWIMAINEGTATISGEDGTVTVTAVNMELVLSNGRPVLATKTAANTWEVTVPPEVSSMSLYGQWAWADTTATPLRYQRSSTFTFPVANYVYNGGEASPISTVDPDQYALKSYVDSQIGARAAANNAVLTGIPQAPTAAAGTSTDQIATTGFATAAVGVAIAAEVTRSNAQIVTSVGTESLARQNADALLLPRLAPVGADITTASYTLAAVDACVRRRLTYAGPVSIVVPTNATVPLAIGSRHPFDRVTGGGTTISPAAGVQVLSLNGILAQAANDAGMSIELIKVAADVWQAILMRPPSRYELERAQAHQQTLTDVVASGGTVAWDMALGNNVYLPFSAFATRVLGAPSNRVAQSRGTIFVKQDSVGSRTLTYNAVFIPLNAAIALNTAASSFTRIDWWDNGTNILLNKA